MAGMRKFMENMRNPAPRRIAILYPTSVPWMARCLAGIRGYAREKGDWHLLCSPPTLRGAEESALTLKSMSGWKGDAIIAATNEGAELRYALKMGIPVVNLAAGLAKSHGVPRVLVDNAQAGRMAADHLLERGLRNLAFFGWIDLWYSGQRLSGFRERAAESGAECATFLQSSQGQPERTWMKQIGGIAKWLRSLPRPAGVFAVTDYRAQFLMEASQEAGLRIPDDIAVIGMDNDETICEHSLPPLTSVSRNSERVGWEAAALLDRMMHGEQAPDSDVFLAPDAIIARQSTDILHCADPLTQRALDYMRAHLKTQFNVEQLADHLGVSKRTLETRFRDGLQSSPHDFLTRLRVQHARELMQMPRKITVEQLVRECGFGSVRAFYTLFHRITGESFAASRRNRAAGNDHQGA